MFFQLRRDTSGFTGNFAALCCNLLSDPFTSPARFLFLAFHVISPVLTQQFPAEPLLVWFPSATSPQRAAGRSEPAHGLDQKGFGVFGAVPAPEQSHTRS